MAKDKKFFSMSDAIIGQHGSLTPNPAKPPTVLRVAERQSRR
jgi:hypothetical protein